MALGESRRRRRRAGRDFRVEREARESIASIPYHLSEPRPMSEAFAGTLFDISGSALSDQVWSGSAKSARPGNDSPTRWAAPVGDCAAATNRKRSGLAVRILSSVAYRRVLLLGAILRSAAVTATVRA